MNIIFTVLFAFAIGYLIKDRVLAVVAYLAVGAIVFAYQTLSVLLSWMADEPPVAFGPSPTGFPVEYSGSELAGYGVVNLVVIVVGVGLVIAGTKVRARRAAKQDVVSVA